MEYQILDGKLVRTIEGEPTMRAMALDELQNAIEVFYKDSQV